MKYRLYIDELGTANPKDIKNKVYVVSGCSINENNRDDAKIFADQIKFKYWGRTDIVFHSKDIGNRSNVFRIFNDRITYKEFLSDLHSFLIKTDFKLFFVVVDKQEALKENWNDIKIYNEVTNEIIKNFLLALVASDTKGKIVIESANTHVDFFYHKALGYFLANGIKEAGVSYKTVQEKLTSISFVTKKNYDIEEQIADLFAYTAKCKYLSGKKKIIKNSYEEIMISILDKKLFKTPITPNVKKMLYYKYLNPFTIIPK